jgi:asparagine synthase (glutamine-hydrolysing)
MCGIIGVINSQGMVGERELALLNDTMRQRGPDGTGLFWHERTRIAMRRLTIIDLKGGQQPLFSEDKTIALVMNGEVYNNYGPLLSTTVKSCPINHNPKR